MRERLKGRPTLSRTEVRKRLALIAASSQGKEEKAGKIIRKLTERYLQQQVDRRDESGKYNPHRILLRRFSEDRVAYIDLTDDPVVVIETDNDKGEQVCSAPSNPEMIKLGPMAVSVFDSTVERLDRDEEERITETFVDAFGPDGTF